MIFTEGGVDEPHWQPNAAELDYVIKGKVRPKIFESLPKYQEDHSFFNI